MRRFSIDKMRRLSRSRSNASREEPTETTSTNGTPAEPPPSYDVAVAGSGQRSGLMEFTGSPVVRTVSAPYRQSHQPPEYQPTSKDTRHQSVPQQTSTSHLRNSAQLNQALSQAALAGKADAVRSLLEAGGEIYESTPSGAFSAIHDALRGPEPELALMLLDYPSERAYQGQSSTNAAMNEEDRVQFLLSVTDEDGCTPLHLAASAGAANVVREMLELGALVDPLDKLGRTPLHSAARYGRGEAMDVLLEYEANAELVHDALWSVASRHAQKELGDSKFVRKAVARAVMKRQGGVEKDEGPGDEDPHTREQIVRAEDDAGLQQAEYEGGVPHSGNTHPLPRGPVASSSRTAGYGASVVPGPVQSSGATFCRYCRGPASSAPRFCTTWHQSSGRRVSRLPDDSMYSMEYESWRKTCQQLQEEHRRQKQRNEESGMGYGGQY